MRSNGKQTRNKKKDKKKDKKKSLTRPFFFPTFATGVNVDQILGDEFELRRLVVVVVRKSHLVACWGLKKENGNLFS
jgi:hypothetical protein